MITKTRIGNHLRRHALGDQPTFRQGFKEGVEFVLKRTPQQRTWVGLTDEDISTVSNNNHPLDGIRSFARAIEAKLKEKNT